MPAYADVVLTAGWIVAGFTSLFTVYFAVVVLREELAARAHGRTGALGSAGGAPRERRSGPRGRRATDLL